MKHLARMLVVSFVSIFCLSCGTHADLQRADAAVANFHNQLDAGNFNQIYQDSGSALKGETSQQNFVDLLSAIHRKLGNVKSAERGGFFVNYGTSGEQIRLNYSTQFDDDKAGEDFVFQVSGNDIRLVGYHVTSNVLVTK